jgi:hypothetical protein
MRTDIFCFQKVRVLTCLQVILWETSYIIKTLLSTLDFQKLLSLQWILHRETEHTVQFGLQGLESYTAVKAVLLKWVGWK